MTGSWDYNTPREPRVYFLPLSSALAVKNTPQPDPSTHTHTHQLFILRCVCVCACLCATCTREDAWCQGLDKCLLSVKGFAGMLAGELDARGPGEGASSAAGSVGECACVCQEEALVRVVGSGPVTCSVGATMHSGTKWCVHVAHWWKIRASFTAGQ